MMGVPRFKKEQIGIRIDNKLRVKLEILASYNKRTLSDYIRVELEKIVEFEEKQGILKDIKETKDLER